MTDPESLDRIRLQLSPLLVAHRAMDPPTPECLDEATLAALVEGTVDAGARSLAIGHLAVCSRCRAAVASLSRALADPAVRRELARGNRRPGRRFARVLLPLAAAAALVLMVSVPRRDEPLPTHRGTAAQGAPVGLAPVGVVTDAHLLRWAPVPGADRYRVTLFDSESNVLLIEEMDDTLLALPDMTPLRPGQHYVWMIEARVGWNRWIASAPASFTVAPRETP